MDEDIKELNQKTKCTLAPSKIHGIGVFALRDIKKEEKLYCVPEDTMQRKWYEIPYEKLNELLPEIREIILSRWPTVINGSAFHFPDVWLMSFMNHSSEPNSEKDFALRNISKGEEITEDYRLLLNYEKIFNFIT